MSKLSLYFHTLKYLKFAQIYHRILKRFSHPKVHSVIGECSVITGSWVSHEIYSPKFLNDTDVEFLNHKGAVSSSSDWNNNEEEKLWLYNLHYFDDLNSFDSDSRRELQQHWINKWIDENPAIKGGNGWESYTLSLRIVNWTKGFLSGLEPNSKMLDSLAQQTDFLSQDLEKHLLGNHYFVNLKALIFAGCFLQGTDEDKWLTLGLEDFKRELKEQVLNDGGSFELTPMYHAIMLTDLLDLFNLFQAFPTRVPRGVVALTKQTIIKMFAWLNIMSQGDDKVSFFNDSAFGIAPENNTLREYAKKLGFNVACIELSEDKLSLYNLQNSGYVSVKTSELSLIADLAPVGPSYQPGHAHADTLSFEMSLDKSRLFVNSGTSEYGMSNERLKQRGTAAHNTVQINGLNSSEVWSGFRVARRAGIGNRIVGKVTPKQSVQFSAAHNGYKKQGINCIHHRTWNVSLDHCVITDLLQGEFDSAIGTLYLHPDVSVIKQSNDEVQLEVAGFIVTLKVTNAEINIGNSTWHPEFGVVIKNKKLCFKFKTNTMRINISWKKKLSTT